jgi:hypothetical protein
MPVFCYVDECQDYISTDEQIAAFLDKARKRRIAMIFATQKMSNIESPKVSDTLSELAIRFIATNEQTERGKFQCFVRRWTTDAPLDVRVPPNVLERMDRMTDAEYDAIRKAMRDKYSIHAAIPASLKAHYEALENWTKLEMLARSYDAVNDLGFVTVGRLRERFTPKQLDTFCIARDQRNDLMHYRVGFPDVLRWIREVNALYEILNSSGEPEPGTSSSPDDDDGDGTPRPSPTLFSP